MKPQARIENWYIINMALVGNVYNHPSLMDGEEIHEEIYVCELQRNYIEGKDVAYILGSPLKISEGQTLNDKTI